MIMKTLEDIKKILLENKQILKEKYKVKTLAIFGSYVRGEQKKSSDIDILVEFEQPVGFLFFHLERYLEEILGIKVDLVTIDAIKPNRVKYILKDLIYV